MVTVILLALAASMFTAGASVLQRAAAAPAPQELSLSWRLTAHLLCRPPWLLGILCMIAGFGFQLSALRSGDLSLVQPVIASELLFVFTFLALRKPSRMRALDWFAAAGMVVALGGFLLLADPAGGSAARTAGAMWALAGTATAGTAGAAGALSAVRLRPGRPPSPSRRAALMAVSAGIVWGFVAAVAKELSDHLARGPGGVLTSWPPYVLIASAAAGLFLASNAFHAGPLAASQPGLTVVDPLVASLLGVTLFGDHIRHTPWFVAGEALFGLLLLGSVPVLARSPLVAASGWTRAEIAWRRTPDPGAGGGAGGNSGQLSRAPAAERGQPSASLGQAVRGEREKTAAVHLAKCKPVLHVLLQIAAVMDSVRTAVRAAAPVLGLSH